MAEEIESKSNGTGRHGWPNSVQISLVGLPERIPKAMDNIHLEMTVLFSNAQKFGCQVIYMDVIRLHYAFISNSVNTDVALFLSCGPVIFKALCEVACPLPHPGRPFSLPLQRRTYLLEEYSLDSLVLHENR